MALARFPDLYSASCYVGPRGHTQHAAVVIGMAVRVDHRQHRLAAQMLCNELECGARSFYRSEWIDHDPACPGVDERHC